MEEKNDSAKELNTKLAQAIKTLFLVLDGDENNRGFFLEDNLEVHIFYATGEKEELELLSKQCGTGLMFGVLEQSKEDEHDLVRDYVILGINFKGNSLDVLTGPGGVLAEFVMGIERDFPTELIYLAIEIHLESDHVIDSNERGDGHIDIFINKIEDVITLCN